VFGGMLQERLKGILARLLAKVRENRDVPAYNGLKRRAEIADHAPRAHDNSGHNAKIPDNRVARYSQARRNIPASTRGIFLLSPGRTFTGAILTVQKALGEQGSSAIL
jgi:ribosomal protein L39E